MHPNLELLPASYWIPSSYKLLACAPNILTEINDVYSVYIKLDDSEVLTLSGRHDTLQLKLPSL